MRTVKLQMQLSADGFVSGPNGEMDWLCFNWDEALSNYVQEELTQRIDTIIMGRKLAEGFIPHWAEKVNSPDAGEAAAAKIFTNSPKLVFSHSLTSSPWERATVTHAPLSETIGDLKTKGEGDILVYGGASFVAGLIKEGLIDEFHFFINPAIIGRGLSITHLLEQNQQLQLKHSRAFSCGIVVNCYEPVR
jgi:dihydrofolate reductase